MAANRALKPFEPNWENLSELAYRAAISKRETLLGESSDCALVEEKMDLAGIEMRIRESRQAARAVYDLNDLRGLPETSKPDIESDMTLPDLPSVKVRAAAAGL